MASGAPDGKWKVVKKGKKSGEKKGERKALSESNVVRPGTTVPIKTSNTVYEMGFEKIHKKQNKEQVPPSNSSAEQAQKKQPIGGKNPKKMQSKETGQTQGKFHTLEEALKALNLSDIQREMERSQNMFGEDPSIWIRDLAGYLNHKLQTVKSEPMTQFTHEYPYCLVSKDLKSYIRSLLVRASRVLDVLVDHCISCILQELDKPNAESVHGYRICIQAVLLDKPKTVTAALPKYLDMVRSHHNRPMKSLTVMWAVGQAGFADLTEGLKVWLGIMFPELGVKSLTQYAISYLDRLLLAHSNLTKGFGMIGPKDFFPILDFAFMPNNSLSSSQQVQLRELYPRLKVLAFGANPETSLHTYFPSFLSRATPNCPDEMKKELLLCLTECLNLDPLSFSVWRQLYTKHLSQSSLLLQHLVDNWNTVSKGTRKSIRETVHSFRVTNGEFTTKGSNCKDIDSCDAACQTLLGKMKGGGFPWLRLLLVTLVFTSGFVIHDIRRHGSFEASTSASVLQQSGLLPMSLQAWSKVSHYSLQGYSWVERNAPLYYSQAVDVLGPILEQVWAKSKEAAEFLCEKGSSWLTYAKDNLPLLIERLHSSIPDSVYHFIEYLKELLLLVHRTYLLPAMMYLEESIQRAWAHYVESCNGKVSLDCLKGQVSNISHSSWVYLQNATMTLKNWAMSMISQP